MSTLVSFCYGLGRLKFRQDSAYIYPTTTDAPGYVGESQRWTLAMRDRREEAEKETKEETKEESMEESMEESKEESK